LSRWKRAPKWRVHSLGQQQSAVRHRANVEKLLAGRKAATAGWYSRTPSEAHSLHLEYRSIEAI
jgi:hypothetical protein